MSELLLTPISNDGSNFFTTISFYGSGYTDAALYVEFNENGKVWIEISIDNINWYKLRASEWEVYYKDVIPLTNFSSILYYRIGSNQKPLSIKLIS